MKYIKKLRFEEKPDYTYLNNLFYYILFKMNKPCDNKFSWNKNNIKKRLILGNISNISKNRVEIEIKNYNYKRLIILFIEEIILKQILNQFFQTN